MRSIVRHLLPWLVVLLLACSALPAWASAQVYGFGAETWGQTYRPAGLLNLEARVTETPWLRAETQVWMGQGVRADSEPGELVVLALEARHPSGLLQGRAGRFVLSTGAVRPVHLDGGHVLVQTTGGSAVEAFAGAPVAPRYTPRDYDWLVGGRLSQRLSRFGALGVSYLERRDHGSESDEEVGADAVLYATPQASLAGRMSWDLVGRGLSELNVTTSLGSVERRAELFANVRNPSLILPATSLFSVLSDAPSVQVGLSGRLRVAPRLRLEGLSAYRSYDALRGARLRAGALLWLDDEGESGVEGVITRDGVAGQRWSGLRGVFYRDLLRDLRLLGELELVRPDQAHGQGALWPWARVSTQYTVRETWQLSAGLEGSSSPQFRQLWQGLVRLSYHVEGGAS